MKLYKVIIQPKSDFGSIIKGDTLFGQFCWAVRERYGDKSLSELLSDYIEGSPYVIFSDACPNGYLPRPVLPLNFWPKLDATKRKLEKAKTWIPEDKISCTIANEIIAEKIQMFSTRQVHHNSVNRKTATVYGDAFAPYRTKQYYINDNSFKDLCIHVLLDEYRMNKDSFVLLLSDMGKIGFGRDASIGLGRFEILFVEDARPLSHKDPNCYLTLAPCVLQKQDMHAEGCYYRPFIRFGRHGNIAAISKKAFKKPVIMADTGATLMTNNNDYNKSFVGLGLGSKTSPISSVISETVHQAYSPVVAIRVEIEIKETY